MADTEIEVRDRIETMDRIAKLWITGTRNVTAIARELKMTRAEVMEYVDEYKAVIREDNETRERAKEALHEADSSLHMVNKENWDLVNSPGIDDKVKATVLKNIADIEVKRVETWQKAGMYDDAAMGDELAEMEEKQQVLISILRDVTAHCPNCKFEVARRLAKVTNKAEPVIIEGEITAG